MWFWAINIFLILASAAGPEYPQYGAFRDAPKGAWVCIGTCTQPAPQVTAHRK